MTLPPHKHNELPKAGTKSYGIGHEPPPLLLYRKHSGPLLPPLLFPCCFADRPSPRKRFHCPRGVFPIVRHPQLPEQLTKLSVECIQGHSEEFQCKTVGNAIIGKEAQSVRFLERLAVLKRFASNANANSGG